MRPRRLRRFWCIAASGAVVVGVVLLALNTGGGGPPVRLVGLYGPRIAATPSGPPCRGAAASAARAVKISASPHIGDLLRVFPDQFAGISLSGHNSTINIFETCSSPTMTRFGPDAAPGRVVRFFFVPHSLRSLNLAFGKLKQAMWNSSTFAGFKASFGVDVPANLVVVEVVDLTRQKLEQIDNVPANLVEVEGTTVSAGAPIRVP